jgi:predicted transcriptional regulator
MLMVVEIMTREVITLKPEMTAEHAAWVLATNGINGAPVLDDGNRLVGMLSKSDLIDPARDDGGDLATPIHRIMSTTVPAVRVDSSALEAVHFMAAQHLERVIVVNQGGLVVGILTPTDIVKAVDQGRGFGSEPEVIYRAVGTA